MNEQDIDKIIGGKLRDYSSQPPQELFSRIEKSLYGSAYVLEGKPSGRRRLATVWKYTGVAALICALLVTSLFLIRDTYTEIKQPAAKSEIVEKNTEQQVETIKNIADIVSEKRMPSQTPRELANTMKVDNAVAVEAETVQKTRRHESENVSGYSDNFAEQPTMPDSDMHESQLSESENKDLRQKVENWDNLLASENSKSRRGKTSLSLFAGNMGGVSGDMQTNNPDKAVAYGMFLRERPGSIDRPSAWVMQNGDSPSLSGFDNNVQEVSMRHYMPVNAGIGVSIPLNERVALNTGLNYSYLFSSSTQSFASGSENRTTRELHYLGIPIGVTYKFLSCKGFNLYIYGGGAVEKGVAWRETYSFSNALDRSREVLNRNVKGVQFSATAAAGVSYDITKVLSVYLEPGVSYYFKQLDQPATYRTAHPTSFSLRIGLRFGI